MKIKYLPRLLANRSWVELRSGRLSLKEYLPVTVLRSYATHTPLRDTAASSRKQVTITSDDGRVKWKDLSIREKAARTTQQTVNFGVILAGFLMTV